MKPGLTGTSAGLEKGGSAAVGTATMVAHGAGARGCGDSSGQGTTAGAQGGGGGGGGGGSCNFVLENTKPAQFH